MNEDGYRSYVIRVRRRPGTMEGQAPSTRLDVEDLLEGGTASVSGETASSLASSLERLVDAGRHPLPPDRAATPGGETAA